MASYRVEKNGVSVECDSPEAAAKLIATLGDSPKAAEERAAVAHGWPPAKPEPPPVEVLDRRSNGAPASRGVETLREIEGAGRLVWDWLTGDEDPRRAIIDALSSRKKSP